MNQGLKMILFLATYFSLPNHREIQLLQFYHKSYDELSREYIFKYLYYFAPFNYNF
jgi:hypothetical protein